jgi:hypothetical protein
MGGKSDQRKHEIHSDGEKRTVKAGQGKGHNPISTVRGMLKATSFSTRRYLKMKKEDKDLER